MDVVPLIIAALGVILVVAFVWGGRKHIRALQPGPAVDPTTFIHSFPGPISRLTHIPSTLHFIYGLWDTAPMPEPFVQTIEEWKAQGEFTIKVWGADDIDAIVPDKYRDMYANMPLPVCKADLARLFVLRHEGGVYLDLDARPGHIPLETVLNDASTHTTACVWTELVIPIHRCARFQARTRRLPVRGSYPESCGERYANYVLATTPNHPLIETILDTIYDRMQYLRAQDLFHRDRMSEYDVLFLTGPDAVTHALKSVYDVEDPKGPIKPSRRTMDSLWRLYMEMGSVKIVHESESRGSVRHIQTGTWRETPNLDT